MNINHSFQQYLSTWTKKIGALQKKNQLFSQIHIKKHLKIGKGGMILTDSEEAANWFRKARYEGRGEVMYHEDNIEINGWNAYMSPEQAARGLMLMQNYPEHNEDLPEFPQYRDLREFPLFAEIKTRNK